MQHHLLTEKPMCSASHILFDNYKAFTRMHLSCSSIGQFNINIFVKNRGKGLFIKEVHLSNL